MGNHANLIICTKINKHILQINLNRPEQLNALSHDLLIELSCILDDVKQDSAIKSLLVTGSGKAFCAGADIKQLAALKGVSGVSFSHFGQSVLRKFEILGKPSLSAIQGYALGGGCELALATTMRIASSEAMFGQPEIKLGVIPGFGGTQRLARLVGKGRALELCLSGRRFSAQEAYAWGLVNELCSEENLITRAITILEEMIVLSPIALQSIMTVIEQGYNLSLEEALELEAAHFGLCCTTQDKQEGVSAFLEKRKAEFIGE